LGGFKENQNKVKIMVKEEWESRICVCGHGDKHHYAVYGENFGICRQGGCSCRTWWMFMQKTTYNKAIE
jgi:3-mercaptopyruvate sulfurtransferase SseA